ncbi:3-deoxy-D-manno-octulosonic acid transferase [Candidatus Uabimicrobium amorphum]|uniref:3-deoxy-D-manno-octulosonic acid transferase n=1 Tax=Uabimicrobium amorphum TaxID=2596890 RepID=A0A5S9IM53_UABAM|nr:glycosyltransferase N-terminal domain-containing protein [Candidatus Uabimicrobium amorphum]BBM83580.1 3-deoxy-D-manno-octulosonic acid transferase [Candidatus Uabimicrobium amorphum]
MPYLLNLVYLTALICAFPFILYRIFIQGKDWRTLLTRLGFGKYPSVDIWIHGVSVGEIKAVQGLIASLKEIYPNKRFFISSTSNNGLKIARELYKEDTISSFPLDFTWSVKSYLRKLSPQLIVLVELEIWPNFLHYAKKYNSSVLLVNGRFSEKSSTRYSYLGKLFYRMTRNIDIFSVQSSLYASRLQKLGIEEQRISITGNLKYDAISLQLPEQKKLDELRTKCGIKTNHHLLVCGSTHDPEEKFIVQAYKKLIDDFPQLRLLIVPRQPQRKDRVAAYAKESGLEALFLSSLHTQNLNANQIIIGDVMGQLVNLYGLAYVVFVGGSLIKHGGQNFIEPSIQKKAVICGPHMQNFPDVKLFVEKKIILQIKCEEELYKTLWDLLKSPSVITDMGNQAALQVKELQGSVEKNLVFCRKLLDL